MTPEQAATLEAIYRKHARWRSDGKIMPCQPSRAERVGAKPRAEPREADGRIILDTQEAAAAVVAELLAEGSGPMETYQCRRGSGHFHARPAVHAGCVAHQDGASQ